MQRLLSLPQVPRHSPTLSSGPQMCCRFISSFSPFAHCLCAFENVCLDYYSTSLPFYSIPSLPFPFNFNPPVRQVPLLQKVISGSKHLQSKLLGRTYQTVWPTSLANLHVYFNFHFPKLLVFFFTFEFAASCLWNIFPISPCKIFLENSFQIQVLLPL